MDRERGSLCPSGSRPRASVPTGDGPAPIIGVELRGARSWFVTSPRGRRARLTVTVWSAVLTGLILTPSAASAQSGRQPATPPVASAASASPSTPLALLSQTAWVAPGQAFDLVLQTGSGLPPVAQLGVSVSVYGCLSSVSAFDQSVASSGPQGTPISSTRAPLALTGLPASSSGGYDLSMRVNAQSSASSGGFAINLSATGGQCGAAPSGVYPVKVQLVNMGTEQVVGSLTTHLVYSDARPDTQKVRLAVVLPLQFPLTASTSPTPAELRSDPPAALRPPSAAAISAVTGTADAITRHPGVPLTLQASPQTITALMSSGHQAAVTELVTAPHQFASAPFTPVNASSLVAGGLGGELAQQVSRGTQELTQVTHGPSQAGGGTGQLGAWFTNDGMDTATLTQLQSDGYSQLVLPSTSVSSSPTNGSTAEPFQLASGRGAPLTAIASNTDLTSRFSSSPGDPVLAAHQLVAEVAQMYYERPNDNSPRALVATAPTGWSGDPVFVDTLLAALTQNPIIQPVTTAELFTSFPTRTCRNGCRLTSIASAANLPAGAIRTQRQRVVGFSSAAPTATTLGAQLGDLVLAGESELLRPSQQSGVVRNAGVAVDAQLGQLVVAGDPVTLTSQRGTVQVTVVSYAGYPVRASLTFTSDKLLFVANGTTQWTTPTTTLIGSGQTGSGHTNIIPVTVQARASGTSKMTIVLRSPTDGLTLSSGQVTVRSTATSLVGILLSLGAVLVLVVWWVRTSRRRRAGRIGKLEPTATATPPEPR